MFGPSSVRGFAPNVPRPGRAVCLAPAPLYRVRHTGRALLLIVGCTTLAACANLSQALPQAALLDAERARSAARARLEPLSDAVDRMRSFVPVDRGLHPACAVRAGGYHAFAGTYRAATFDIVAYLFTPTVEPVGSVLVLHGYLANAGHMCGITRALLAADFVVLTPHLPGHGLSGGDRGDIDDFAQYAAVVDASVQVLSELDFGPLHAVGHSTGATALYEYLVHDPDPFERVIFAAPLLLLGSFGSEEIVFQSPDAWEYLTYFMFAVVLIPFQAGFEEVFFRGYLMQGFALLTRNRVLLVVVTAVIFTLPHLPNPEPWEYGVVPYVARILTLGGFFALLTLLDGGIELAVGIHVINNLIYTLLAATSVSVIQSPALFLIEVEEFRLFPDIIVLWVMLAIVFTILNRKYQWFGYHQLTSFLKRQRD